MDTHLQALELARQFNLKSLEKILIDQLVESITLENFSDFFNLNTRYENVKLQKTCDDFLVKYSEEITASDNFPKLTLVSGKSLLDYGSNIGLLFSKLVEDYNLLYVGSTLPTPRVNI